MTAPLPLHVHPCVRPEESPDTRGVPPAYLYRKRNIYYFRYALPKLLKQSLGCSEVRVSLRTAYLRAARFRARMLYAELAKSMLDAPMLDYKEIRRRMNIVLQKILEKEHQDISKRNDMYLPELNTIISYEKACELSARAYTLGNNDEGKLTEMSDEILDVMFQSGIFHPDEIIDEDDQKTRKNAMQLLKAFNETMISWKRIAAARERGDFLMEEPIVSQDFGKLPCEEDGVPGVSTAEGISMPEQSTASPKPSFLYAEAMERYIDQKLSDGAWATHSLPDHRGRLEGFLELIGNKYIREITRENMRTFRKTLRKLPPNRTKAKAYKGKSIAEILALDIPQTLSVKTINIHMEAVASMFDWCVREGWLESNPAKGLQVKDKRQAVELRDAFTCEELRKIFTHPQFLQNKFKSPAYFWIPLIALYSGMRLEEIAQLHCNDVYDAKTKGIWIFDINDAGLDEKNLPKLLKNKNARRQVPLHPVLIDAGFLKYHNEIACEGHIRLFPNLNKTDKTTKFGKQPGKRFKAVVTATLGDIPGKTFHSLRHTFADFYKQRDLQNDYFRQVFGHELPTLAAKQYGSKFSAERLYEEVISKLDYGIKI